jgi:hypothetical protein
MSNQPTVSDIFRRAQAIREDNSAMSYKDISARLVSEFDGKPFPDPNKLTIPDQNSVTPEEDWTAGLPVVLRGIQTESWSEIAHGIIICLEQVENYPKESGREDAPGKEWRDRSKGIGEAEKKNTDKWMPEELMALAQRNTRK